VNIVVRDNHIFQGFRAPRVRDAARRNRSRKRGAHKKSDAARIIDNRSDG
jgi:hypothetical protein